jgi:DNA polymerase-3 subunit delta
MDSLTFLSRAPKGKVQPLYVVHGDEDFLKRLVLKKLRVLVLGEDADDFALSVHAGDRAEYAAVMDELHTVPFFGPRRLVIVEAADAFVSDNRAALEKVVERLPETGTLILEVKTWQGTTRLAKLVKEDATIVCKTPPTKGLAGWCIEWANAQHGKQLTQPAAALLVELIGADMGQLDQELQKLAVYVGTRSRIQEEDVDKLVGRSAAQNTWIIFDAITGGRVGEALAILDRLLSQGEEPIRLVGAFSLQLRRVAQIGRLMQQGVPQAVALEEAGLTNPYFAKTALQQLKHLGPTRVASLYDWLLELNLDLRGNSPLPPRTLLERFVIRLARN